MIRRLGAQNFGIVGLGRIGTAVALRAKAFNFRVVFYDPCLPNGVERALGIDRATSLEELLRQTDRLSIHPPLTPETRALLGHAELGLLRPGAIVINDARGPILDLDALLEHLKSGHIAAAALDVLPVEPVPELRRLDRTREPWLEGRLVVTPHAAWLTPESEADTRRKSAETMRAALLTNRPQNVITPKCIRPNHDEVAPPGAEFPRSRVDDTRSNTRERLVPADDEPRSLRFLRHDFVRAASCTYPVEIRASQVRLDTTKTSMGIRVRVPFPPAASPVRTCLSREFAFLRREAGVFRGCAGWGERRGRQRRAGCGNIGPTGGNISVGRYSSTAPQVTRAA
jgi:hypothetical protein